MQEAAAMAREALGNEAWSRLVVQGAALDDEGALALARAISGAV